MFRAAALATIDVEPFYDELESQYDDEEAARVEELRRFGAEYGRLSDEFELVYSERIHDLRNPMPTLRRGFRYSSGIELPLLDYDLYSGDVELCRFVHPPSQALMLARSIVANTTRLLEQIEENGDGIAATERELLALVYEDLEEEVAALDEFVGAGEREEDPKDPEEAEPYQDWSVY